MKTLTDPGTKKGGAYTSAAGGQALSGVGIGTGIVTGVGSGLVAGHATAVGAAAATDLGWALKKLYQLNIQSTATTDVNSSTNQQNQSAHQKNENASNSNASGNKSKQQVLEENVENSKRSESFVKQKDRKSTRLNSSHRL